MNQSPNDLTIIHDEIWGNILSLLAVRDMVSFIMSAKAANRGEIISSFWRAYLLKIAKKQFKEVQHFQQMKEELIQQIKEAEVNHVEDERYANVLKRIAILKIVDGIDAKAITLEEFKKVEGLLDELNAELIKTCINIPDRPSGILNVSLLGLTRIPKCLLNEPALQKYFHDLQELYCNDNLLTALDVSMFSSLQILICNGNQLRTLDTSCCLMLGELDCHENLLVSLNIGKNKSLKSLACQNNKLINVDVSGCEALDSFNCNENKINLLDISHCLLLRTLLCNHNKLITLIIRAHPELKRVECRGNPLQSLEVSHCSKLSKLKFDQTTMQSFIIDESPLLQRKGYVNMTPSWVIGYDVPLTKRRKVNCAPVPVSQVEASTPPCDAQDEKQEERKPENKHR